MFDDKSFIKVPSVEQWKATVFTWLWKHDCGDKPFSFEHQEYFSQKDECAAPSPHPLPNLSY